jgi:hypothetical protein
LPAYTPAKPISIVPSAANLIPHRTIDVVAVNALQVFDRLFVLQKRCAANELSKPRAGVASLGIAAVV